MKKILSLFFALLIVMSLVTACKKPPKPLEISEEEANAVLCDLVPKSYEFNVIFFGEGLPHDASGEYDKTEYVEVDLNKSKYSSVTAIKIAVEQVYSQQYLSSVYVNMFVGSKTDSDDGLLDNNVSPRYKMIDGRLMIDASYQPLKITDKLTVVSTEIVKKAPKYVSVNALCRDEDGNEITKLFFITLENGVWLLDGPTY